MIINYIIILNVCLVIIILIFEFIFLNGSGFFFNIILIDIFIIHNLNIIKLT